MDFCFTRLLSGAVDRRRVIVLLTEVNRRCFALAIAREGVGRWDGPLWRHRGWYLGWCVGCRWDGLSSELIELEGDVDGML